MSHALSTVRGRIAISVVALAVLAAVGGLAVFSAFSSTTASSQNSFTAGSVVLTSDATGSVLFSLPAMAPGDSATKCVTVTYNGTLPAGVGMYATQSGTLAGYLSTQVVRGTFPGGPPASNDCTGFTPDAGGGSLFSGLLSGMPDSTSPIADPDTWGQGDSHVYEISVTLPGNVDPAAEGQQAQATFSWQAQNS